MAELLSRAPLLVDYYSRSELDPIELISNLGTDSKIGMFDVEEAVKTYVCSLQDRNVLSFKFSMRSNSNIRCRIYLVYYSAQVCLLPSSRGLAMVRGPTAHAVDDLILPAPIKSPSIPLKSTNW